MGRGWGRSEGWGGDGTERTGGRGVLAVAQDSIQLRSSVTLSPPPHTDTHTHTHRCTPTQGPSGTHTQQSSKDKTYIACLQCTTHT